MPRKEFIPKLWLLSHVSIMSVFSFHLHQFLFLQTEIAGHEPRIRAVCDNGVQMIDNGKLKKLLTNLTLGRTW